MFLLIICNSFVVIGVIFNFHFLLLPWLGVYIIGIISMLVIAFLSIIHNNIIISIFMLIASILLTILWVFINQIRVSIRSKEWEVNDVAEDLEEGKSDI